MIKIKLFNEDGIPLEESLEASETLLRVAEVFEKCLTLIEAKSVGYGKAWQEQGWMGNLSRIMSKSARLRNMLWVGNGKVSRDESVEDTAEDLINLTAFFLINREFKNQWGGEL